MLGFRWERLSSGNPLLSLACPGNCLCSGYNLPFTFWGEHRGQDLARQGSPPLEAVGDRMSKDWSQHKEGQVVIWASDFFIFESSAVYPNSCFKPLAVKVETSWIVQYQDLAVIDGFLCTPAGYTDTHCNEFVPQRLCLYWGGIRWRHWDSSLTLSLPTHSHHPSQYPGDSTNHDIETMMISIKLIQASHRITNVTIWDINLPQLIKYLFGTLLCIVI